MEGEKMIIITMGDKSILIDGDDFYLADGHWYILKKKKIQGAFNSNIVDWIAFQNQPEIVFDNLYKHWFKN